METKFYLWLDDQECGPFARADLTGQLAGRKISVDAPARAITDKKYSTLREVLGEERYERRSNRPLAMPMAESIIKEITFGGVGIAFAILGAIILAGCLVCVINDSQPGAAAWEIVSGCFVIAFALLLLGYVRRIAIAAETVARRNEP